MDLLNQIRSFLKPQTVKCNTNDLENHLQAAQMQDEYEAHIPEKRHRVPSFQQLFTPVLMVISSPEFIKGFKFEFGLPLSQYFATSHAWTIPNSGTTEENPNPMMMMQVQQKPNYTFSTQLVQDIRGQQPYTIMMGKADSDGKVEGIFVRKLHPNLSFKLNAGFQSSNVEQGVINTELQLENKHSTGSFKLGQGHWGFGFNQRVHPNLIVGFDYLNLTAQKLSLWSYGLKVFIRNHSLFVNYLATQQQYNLSYMIPIKKGTQFVANYRYDAHERSPTTTFGFKQRYSQSDILATINSKGEVSACISLKNPSYSLKLCALIDYMKDKYSFGYGITLGQSI